MGRKGDDEVRDFIKYGKAVGVRHLVSELHIPESQAADLMTTILYDICSKFARQTMYVPAVLEVGRTKRDQKIAEAYAKPGPTGSRPYSHDRVKEIAADEQMTPTHIYAILRLWRQRDAVDRQQTVPGLETVDEAQSRQSGQI